MAKYRVHSAAETTIDVPAKTEEGVDVVGKLRVLVVELVGLDSWGGTITHREMLTTDEARAASLEKFARGAVVEASFAQVEPAPAPETPTP